jgi:hypothetical protein
MADPNHLTKLTKLLTGKRNESYEETAKRLRVARQIFHECVAEQAQDPMNERAQVMPHSSHEEKKRLVNWVNAECRSMGVAIQCPNTGEPTSIVAPNAENPGIGRFRLRPFSDDTKRSFTSTDLFRFVLIPHYERRNNRIEKSTER